MTIYGAFSCMVYVGLFHVLLPAHATCNSIIITIVNSLSMPPLIPPLKHGHCTIYFLHISFGFSIYIHSTPHIKGMGTNRRQVLIAYASSSCWKPINLLLCFWFLYPLAKCLELMLLLHVGFKILKVWNQSIRAYDSFIHFCFPGSSLSQNFCFRFG